MPISCAKQSQLIDAQLFTSRAALCLQQLLQQTLSFIELRCYIH